jgi:hypothetical protein
MRRLVLSMLPLVIAATAGAQGSTLPGGHPTTIDAQRAQYSSAMRAEVDTLLVHLTADLKSRNAGWIASSYADGAVITLTDQNRIERRDEIKKYFARIFERAQGGALLVQDVTELRGGFRVQGQFLFQMRVAGGGDPYELVVPVALDMHPGAQNVLAIDAQAGGDVPIITALGGDKVRSIAVGKGDSLQVKVTDAAGIAIPNVPVTFNVSCGGGTVSPDTAKTSGEGIATTYFSAGTAARPECVEAVVSLLPEVPLQFRIRATAVAP